jgi:ABC-2 type transport system permease protein
MRKALLIAKREYLASVKTKGFIIGLIVAPFIMSASTIAIVVFKDREVIDDKTIAVIDHSGVVTEVLLERAEKRNTEEIFNANGKKIRPAYLLEIVESHQRELQSVKVELSDRVRAGELHAFLEIGPGVLHPLEDNADSEIAYHSKGSVMDEMRNWFEQPINHHLRRLRLSEAGVPESSADDIMAWLDVEPLELLSIDPETGEIKGAERVSELRALLIPIALMMLLFIMVMMSATPLLQAVMEEKNQRIAEVMLSAVTPSGFMAGKLLGGVAVSLTGALFYLVAATVATTHFGVGGYIPFHILPWFFIYMMSAIIMLGSIYAALGSACNDAKDAQNLTFPAMLPMLIPMFIIIPVLKEPSSTFSTALSLFPLFTPTLMLLRVSSPTGAPAWQPWAGLIGVLVFSVLSVWIGGRIFRVGILSMGQPPSLRNMIRWAMRG